MKLRLSRLSSILKESQNVFQPYTIFESRFDNYMLKIKGCAPSCSAIILTLFNRGY